METLTAADFRKTQLLRDGTWVVAFLADWCPFCRSFRPEFSPLEAGSGFRVAFGDVTSEESPLWEDFQIDVVPTLVVFREGRPVFRVDGVLGLGVPPGGLEQARAAARARAK
ncbi:MAG TPA: thioredoxin family protein [Thermoplasmata archaeon]|nr:thioredoxin family protein [Thermoplasmata archaeon]